MASRADDTDGILALLVDPDPRSRVFMLQELADSPTGLIQVLPRLETLMSDTEVTVLGRPFVVGEVRWVAARALAAERRIQGVEEPVAVIAIPMPLGTESIATLAETCGLRLGGGIEGLVAAYLTLRERHRVPTTDLNL